MILLDDTYVVQAKYVGAQPKDGNSYKGYQDVCTTGDIEEAFYEMYGHEESPDWDDVRVVTPIRLIVKPVDEPSDE